MKVLEVLAEVFESVTPPAAWGGYTVPFQIRPQDSAGPASYDAPDGPAWSGYLALPFHTKAAEEVWEVLKDVAHEDSDLPGDQMIIRAVERAGLGVDLTPEDVRLLDLGVRWLKSKIPAKPKP